MATRDDLAKGRELADIGQCCPTAFATGNPADFLLQESGRIGPAAVGRDDVYATAGSYGVCRFGQHHQSYELALRKLGMDQPTCTPMKAINEQSGTLYFGFQDLDATKPAGAVKIRIETIAYYLAERGMEIMARKPKRPGLHPELDNRVVQEAKLNAVVAG